MNANDAADKLGVSARTLRKFLRASPHYRGVGQGRSYDIAEEDLEILRSRMSHASSLPPEQESVADDDAETLTDLDDLASLEELSK